MWLFIHAGIEFITVMFVKGATGVFTVSGAWNIAIPQFLSVFQKMLTVPCTNLGPLLLTWFNFNPSMDK